MQQMIISLTVVQQALGTIFETEYFHDDIKPTSAARDRLDLFFNPSNDLQCNSNIYVKTTFKCLCIFF